MSKAGRRPENWKIPGTRCRGSLHYSGVEPA
ncbi:MAG: hypothetical protein JWR90_3522 [Marmoricola sp.]|jgi:hypothetical protein|nr:hypothetical protein [Marmoricola sp.]